MEEVKQRDQLIQHLEREIQTRDRQIADMQTEMDKFKQILKPMTQQLTQNLSIQALVLEDDGKPAAPGRDGNASAAKKPLGLSTLGSGMTRAKEKVEGVAARMKRIAISAEPSKKVVNPKDMVINKIDKGDR